MTKTACRGGSAGRATNHTVAMAKLPIILCITAIGSFATGRALYELSPYLAGLRGYDAIAQRYAFGSMLLVGGVLVIGILSAIALGIVEAQKVLFARTARRRAFLGTSIRVAAIAVAVWLSLWNVRPGNYYLLFGLESFARDRANLPELQRWCRELDATSTPDMIPREEWPPEVVELSPASVSFRKDEGRAAVSLVWGGGFMHCGLTIWCGSGGRPSEPALLIRELDDRSFVWVDSE